MTARLLVGDVHERLREIPDNDIDFLLTSPPFLALRSYLPDGHPDKAKEIGTEPTPAAYIDVLLQLTAEWGRVLAPHGSIAVELGDTYAGSGGAGGDYGPDGLRDGQQAWSGSAAKRAAHSVGDDYRPSRSGRQVDDWPLAKSLACIPQLYQVALAYGINPLTGQPSPAGRWRVRTLKPWIRSNPPVGALGDKERPATSYVIVACRASDRWFDLDAVRTIPSQPPSTYTRNGYTKGRPEGVEGNEAMPGNAGGAPPRDWWHHVDAVLDSAIEAGPTDEDGETRLRGVHLRRALERAGILTTLEALDVSPRGYTGAHYAVWPPELCRLLIDEMCPRRVCMICGEPSRRLTESEYVQTQATSNPSARGLTPGVRTPGADPSFTHGRANRVVATIGWSDCGHNAWRPGHILDPFAGSGTTLSVATGMGRTVTGIDIDPRNADLARERVGMFLEIDHPTQKATT